MSSAQVKYHIIGAGIAGLQTAQLLKRKYPQAQIIVYEAAEHIGGRCYSFSDNKLAATLDNATHAVLRGNTLAAKLLGKNAKFGSAAFYSPQTNKISRKKFDFINDKALALFNLPLNKVAQGVVFKTLSKLFPFTSRQLDVWFSSGDLSSKLIEPLAQGLDIRLGWKLKGFAAQDDYIYKLIFNKESIALLPQDKVISALDAHNFVKIFGGEDFAYNEIINIFYRTSMQISLPEGLDFLGLSNMRAQWLFSSPGILAVTISDAKNIKLSDEELALSVWKEVCALREHQSVFLPAYRVLRHKRATIRQDSRNNDLRPSSCQSKWKNMSLAGDWTMKNWPCSIETALTSAIRAANYL